MSNVSINTNVMLRGLKIYMSNGVVYADLVGEALSDIGPVTFNFPNIQLDFNEPEKTDASIFYFRDGNGRIGYNFNFGDVMYVMPEDKPVDEEKSAEDEAIDVEDEG